MVNSVEDEMTLQVGWHASRPQKEALT